MTVGLSGREIVAVYLLLRRAEPTLDPTLVSLKSRLEQVLYSSLSIEEFEELERLYVAREDLLAGP